MTDAQIERLVIDELKKRAITFYDMIGSKDQNIDPDPEDKTRPANKRARRNRFRGGSERERMTELLCLGEFNPYESLPPLKVSLKDLFRFWWNRCISQDLVVEEILEDVFSYFTELMRPPQKKPEQMDMTLDFERLSDLDQAA
jgi:hypothetical protein